MREVHYKSYSEVAALLIAFVVSTIFPNGYPCAVSGINAGEIEFWFSSVRGIKQVEDRLVELGFTFSLNDPSRLKHYCGLAAYTYVFFEKENGNSIIDMSSKDDRYEALFHAAAKAIIYEGQKDMYAAATVGRCWGDRACEV